MVTYLVIQEAFTLPLLVRQGALMLALLVVLLSIVSLWGSRRAIQRVEPQPRVSGQDDKLEVAHQRLEAVFALSQSFIEAQDDQEVIEAVLRLIVELTAAMGASFIPFDELGQPYARLKYGETPQERVSSWFQTLVTPEIREQCHHCEHKGGFVLHRACPLLSGAKEPITAVFCLQVQRGEREYGVLNLYVDEVAHMDEPSLAFVRTLADEMALGFENLSMRRREMAASRQIQILRQQTDLPTLFSELLENIAPFMEVDYACIQLEGKGVALRTLSLSWGELPKEAESHIAALIQEVLESGETKVWDEIYWNGLPTEMAHSVAICPITSTSGEIFGALLLGRSQPSAYQPEWISLLHMLARQLAPIVQNLSMLRDLEYKVIFQERKNLAREIHDGLAQMLGYIRMQMAQMSAQLDQGDLDRFRYTLELCYQAVSDAYLEARQVIDGLRLAASDCGVMGWLEQMVEEFEELSGVPVEIHVGEHVNGLSPEVDAQLMRIVQEALNNVRKHAGASKVCISCNQLREEMVLEIRDDGKGFPLEEVHPTWQHGLQGMRERAALIGARMEIESTAGRGTRVEVRLPLSVHLPKELVR